LTADVGPIGSASIGAACAIFDGRRRVLLVRHTYGHLNWEIPGGIALPGEEPSAAASRELAEETSLIVAKGTLSGVYYEPGHDFGPMLHFVFRFPWQEGMEAQANPPEIGAVGWYDPAALPTPMSDFTERRIHDALGPSVTYRLIEARSWRLGRHQR
jgi:8-oxo-dGTP diphosphatase